MYKNIKIIVCTIERVFEHTWPVYIVCYTFSLNISSIYKFNLRFYILSPKRKVLQ